MKKKAHKAAKKPATKKKAVGSVGPLAPLNDRVVVRPLSADEMGTTTVSGIIIPDSSKEKTEQGTVIAVGPGRWEEGARVPVSVPIGARVMVREYSKNTIKINGQEYWVVSESDVLAVFN